MAAGTENLIISVSLTLFMLSLITEKISNFIKLNFPKLFMKSDDPLQEKQRERKIQLLTGIIGIAVALLCNADFFILIKQNGTIAPLTHLSLEGILGCIVTGLFLSQGSKFFHDLLDTVLYYKNVKKALYSKQELENNLLQTNNTLNADTLINAVTADQRQDDEDVNN
jgi:hypothetical protein